MIRTIELFDLGSLLGSRLLLGFALLVGPGSLRAAETTQSPIRTLGTVEEFPAVEARHVRMTILRTTADHFPILNEVEIYSAGPEPRNVALAANGAKASALATQDGNWSVNNLNDGRSIGWWAGQEGTNNWIQIELPKAEIINRIVWSRSRAEPQRTRGVWMATPIDYRFEVAVEAGRWREVANARDHPPFARDYEFELGVDVADTLRGPFIQPLADPLVELPTTNSVRTPPQYRVDHWGEDNEALQATIGAMIETPEGYLWIGTELGLVRFDGNRFETFTRDNTPALNAGKIYALNLDPKGRLLILLGEAGMGNNLVLYDHGRFKRLDLGGAWVRTFFTDRAGRFWGFTSRGLLPWNGDGFDLNAGITSLEVRIPYSATPDYRSNFWASVGAQIGKLEQGRFVPLAGREGRPLEFGAIPHSPILEPGPDGRIWILEGGVMGETARAPERWRHLLPDGTLTESKPLPWVVEFRSARCDRAGNLWICSPHDGLFVLSADGASYQRYTEAEGLTRREVQISYEDREGNIWVGGWRGGLDRLRKPPFQSVPAAAGIGSENVYSLAPARAGGVWIGTHSRSNYLWNAGKTYLHTGASPHSWAVMEDRTGVLWNGNYNDGLRRLPPGEIERFYSPEGGRHRYTFALFEDRSGRVWAGGEWGLSCYDRGKMSDYLPPSFDRNAFEWVNSLAEDGDGSIWLGTKQGFLHRFQKGEFTTFLKSEPDARFPVCALHFHRPGELWLARFGFGLSRLKDGQLTDYTPAQGLPTSTLNGILDDGRGFLWMTSKQGVYRIAKADFDAFADHQTVGVRWERFTQKDGLPGTGCQGEQNKPSLCQTPDGRIWVPTLGGVGVIDPATLPQAESATPAVIESVLLHGAGASVQTLLTEGEFNAAPATPGTRLTIPHGKNNLVIHYTGIDLTDSKNVSFKYRLTGLDHEWVDAGNNRSAIYAALPAGAYQFELIAINHRGTPGRPATLALQVLPFWWETRSFQAVLIGLLLAVGPLVFFFRVRWLERRHALQAAFSRQLLQREEDERKRVAQEVHDVLGHELLLLKNAAAQGERRAEPGSLPQEQFTQISALASRALQESREIAHRLRPIELDRLGLTAALEALLDATAASSGLRVFREIDDVGSLLPAELQVHLYRLVQEGLNNILKHARATTVMFELQRDGDRLRLHLGDDGAGFDPATAEGRRGLGLTGMEERVRLVGGEFELTSTPGSGTHLRVSFPLPGPMR